MLKVAMNNIRSIDHINAEFYPGINLIVGKNGAGKTTLCNALFISLYGRMIGSSKNYKNLIKKGSKNGSVSASIQFPNGKNVRVERFFYLNSPSDVKTYIDNSEVDVNPTKLIPQEIAELMYLQLDKLDFFKYFDVDKFVQKYETKIKILDEEILKLEKIKTEINTLKSILSSELKKQKEMLEESQQRISKLLSLKSNIESNLYFKSEEEFVIFKETYTKAKEEYIKTVESEREKRRSQIDNITSQIKILESELEKIKVEQDKEEKDVRIKLSNELHAKDKELISKHNETVGSLKANINSLQKEKSKISQIQGKSVCPLCGSELNTEKTEEIINHIEEELKILENKLNKETTSYANQKRELEREYKEKEKKLIQEIRDKYNVVINEKRSKIDELKNTLENIKKTNLDLTSEEKQEISNRIKQKHFGNLANIVTKEFMEKQEQLFDQLIRCKIEIEKESETKKRIERAIFDIENKLTELQKYDSIDDVINECKKAKFILSKINKRDIKRHLSVKVFEIINNIAMHYSSLFPIKVIPELKAQSDNYIIDFNAINFNGELIPLSELSSGETVVVKIIINLVIRDFLRLLPEYKNTEFFNIVFIDEYLDRLDEYNAQFVLELLQTFDNFIFVIVTHRADLVQSFSFGVSNIIYL